MSKLARLMQKSMRWRHKKRQLKNIWKSWKEFWLIKLHAEMKTPSFW